MSAYIAVNERQVKLTHLDRLLWPRDGLTKNHLVQYYIAAAPYLLPHLRGRPLVFQRFPRGVEEEGFYQKNVPPGAPSWLKTFPVEHEEKTTQYVTAADLPALLWIANQSCIEIHPWLSSVNTLENPDFAVIDLDPMEHSTFEDVREIALVFQRLLKKLHLEGFPKTSGATGIQIYLPLVPRYTYRQVREAVEMLCRVVAGLFPGTTTIERQVKERKGKIYLDYLQNVRGKTLVAPYSPRPLPGAPVSMPLTWEEVEKGGFVPADFTLRTAPARLKEKGDIFAPVLTQKQRLEDLLVEAEK